MPNQQNITIKLIAAPLAVTAGNAVKLRAETSVNAGELAEQCFNDRASRSLGFLSAPLNQ